MINIYITLFSLLLCSNPLLVNDKEGLLWEISGKDLSHPSFLLGTAHRFSIRIIDRIPHFENAFNLVDQIVVEVDTFDFEKSKALKIAYDKFLPKGVKYSQLLNKTDLQFLDSVVTKYWNIKADKVPIKPDALYEELKREIIAEEKVLDTFPINGISKETPFHFLAPLDPDPDKKSLLMDVELMNRAKISGYRIIGLETLEEQMKLKLYPDISLERSAKVLVEKLKNHTQLLRALYGVVEGYFEQDLKKIWLSFELSTRLSGLGDSYALNPIGNIKVRNEKWMPLILSAIQNRPSMIIVGAGHLPGEYGLINLLRQQGYNVKPYKL